MNKMIAVATREIVGRKLLFFAAPVFGCMLAGAGFIAHDRGPGIAGATVAALIYGVCIALVIGSSLVGRELGERRMSFYFSRPISGSAIWAGKLLGGLATVVASTIIVLIPSLIAYRGLPTFADGGIFVSVILGMSIATLSLGIVLGIILRSKSAWVALDLTVLIGAGFLTGWAFRIFDDGVFTEWGPAMAEFLTKLVLIAVGIVAIVMFIAGAAAVIGGRSDLRRAHRAASLVLLALIPAAVAGVVWAHWFVRPAAADVTDTQHVTKSPNGEWISTIARFRGRGPVTMPVLLSSDRKRIVHVGPFYDGMFAPVGAFTPGFSADGRVAAWMAWDAPRYRATLATVRLDEAALQPQRSKTLVFHGSELTGWPPLQLSPTGEYAVLSQKGERIVFYRVSDGAMLLSIPAVSEVRFTSPTRGTTNLAAWSGNGKPLPGVFGEFDLESRHYEKVSEQGPSRPTP